jgi:O-antigen/teichoic acid export membrane protein
MTVLERPVADPLRHFQTDHLLADLKGRSVRGGAVTISSQAVKFVIQLGSTAVLARLLTPADFGLVAMVAAFTGFVALFKDLGLSMATVQRAEMLA